MRIPRLLDSAAPSCGPRVIVGVRPLAATVVAPALAASGVARGECALAAMGRLPDRYPTARGGRRSRNTLRVLRAERFGAEIQGAP